MIAGASWGWWVGFHLVVVAFLAFDFLLPARGRERHPNLMAWITTATVILSSGLFALWLGHWRGRGAALEFVASYAIESSLSIDNLFVFLVIFRSFKLGAAREHKALLYGVGGAIVLRALFIAAGVALLSRFEWVGWIFGLALLYAAWRLVTGDSAEAAAPAWIGRLQKGGKTLLPVILALELTDIIFAFDSVPAVLAITRDPLIAYTSNIAAILGLRSFYSVLASLLDRLHYLHYGLGALLAFVAFKMLAAHWIEIPIGVSLGVCAAILGLCAIVSLVVKPAKAVQ